MTENPIIKPLRVLIINLHSSSNNGDAALTKVAIEQINKYFPNSTITLAMNDPNSHLGDEKKVGSFLFWMHQPKDGRMKWKYFTILKLFFTSLLAVFSYRFTQKSFWIGLTPDQRKTLQSYFEADLVISAPGNFIYTSGKLGLTLLIVTYTMFYSVLSGKPLYLFPQSIGPLNRWRDRKLVQYVLNRARIVMVREPISLKEIYRAGVTNPKCFIVPDIAFSFRGLPKQEAITWLESFGIDFQNDQPLLGITVINWGAQTNQPKLQQRYEKAILETIVFFLENTKGKVIFFPQVCGSSMVNDDRVPAKRIAENTQEIEKRVIYIDQLVTPELLKATYECMDIFIGTRMHSNIFALSGGVPVVAVAYRHKTQGIMEMMGLENWTIEIENINGELLTDKLISLWKNKNIVRNHIQKKSTELAKIADQAGKLIALDFAELSTNHGKSF